MSAPLILDPTAGDMTKDMKAVCRDFEMVTGWRIPVVERVGKVVNMDFRSSFILGIAASCN